MKRFLLLASLAAVAVSGVAAIPATDAGAVICKGKKITKKKIRVKCPTRKLRGPQGPAGPQGPVGPAGPSTGSTGAGGAGFIGSFSLRGDAVIPATNLFAGDNFEFDAACNGGGDIHVTLEAVGNSVGVSSASLDVIGEDVDNGVLDNSQNVGEADENLAPDDDDSQIVTTVVRPPSGNNSVLIYSLEEGEQGDDCRVDGIGLRGQTSAPTS